MFSIDKIPHSAGLNRHSYVYSVIVSCHTVYIHFVQRWIGYDSVFISSSATKTFGDKRHMRGGTGDMRHHTKITSFITIQPQPLTIIQSYRWSVRFCLVKV